MLQIGWPYLGAGQQRHATCHATRHAMPVTLEVYQDERASALATMHSLSFYCAGAKPCRRKKGQSTVTL